MYKQKYITRIIYSNTNIFRVFYILENNMYCNSMYLNEKKALNYLCTKK